MSLARVRSRLKSFRNRIFGVSLLEERLRESRDVLLSAIENLVAPATQEEAGEAIGPVSRSPKLLATHHPIFCKFGPGTSEAPPGFHREYGGNIYSQDILTPSFSMTEEGYPAPSEELFEWIALLESIDDADDTYVMAELGAGFGRWLGAAACLLRRHKPVPFRLIGVEAEPVHFEWMKRYFSDNGLDWREHHLVQAAVGGSDGFAQFVVGNPREWYGQAIAHTFDDFGWSYADRPEAKTVKVPMISLETLFKDERKIDFVHMDIQGSELEVVRNSHKTLSDKVRRVHVATHHADAEELIYNTLRREGWFCTATYPTLSTSETPYGTVTFGDGIQSWVNPRFFQPRA